MAGVLCACSSASVCVAVAAPLKVKWGGEYISGNLPYSSSMIVSLAGGVYYLWYVV